MRKGEIAISVVVIIALSLIVLISLAVMLVEQFGRANTTLGDCQNLHGGTCTLQSACQASEGKIITGVNCAASTMQKTESGRQLISFPPGGTICCVTA